jgi:CO/xanthine dehydrogenase Mo-binding subunit
MGEVGTPLVAPALANAVAKLTGKRVRIGARCPHSG